MEIINIPVNNLSLLIPNKGALYRILIKELDYFLPKETSKAISEEYLLGVLRGQFYSLKNSEKRELQLKEDLSAGKLELIDEISQKISKPLGFTFSTSPDRNWLLDVLNTIDPNNKLIIGDPSLEFSRAFPKE